MDVWVNGTTDGDELQSAAQTVRIQSIKVLSVGVFSFNMLIGMTPSSNLNFFSTDRSHAQCVSLPVILHVTSPLHDG